MNSPLPGKSNDPERHENLSFIAYKQFLTLSRGFYCFERYVSGAVEKTGNIFDLKWCVSAVSGIRLKVM